MWQCRRTAPTGLGVHGRVEVHIGIAEGAAGDGVTADADGGDWADLRWRITPQHV